MACFKVLHPEKQVSLYDQPSASSLVSRTNHFKSAYICNLLVLPLRKKTPKNCKLLNFLFFVTCDTNVTSSHPALPISTTTAPRAASYIADRRTSWCVSITANAIRVLRQPSAWSVIQCSVTPSEIELCLELNKQIETELANQNIWTPKLKKQICLW